MVYEGLPQLFIRYLVAVFGLKNPSSCTFMRIRITCVIFKKNYSESISICRIYIYMYREIQKP